MNMKERCKERLQFCSVANGAVTIFTCELPKGHSGYHQTGGPAVSDGKEKQYRIMWKDNDGK